MSESTTTTPGDEFISTIQGTATEAAQLVLNWLRAAGDLVVDEAPKFASEMVTRGIVVNLIDAFAFLVLAIIAIAGAWYGSRGFLWAKGKEIQGDGTNWQRRQSADGWFIGAAWSGAGAVIVALIGLGGVWANVSQAVAIWVAPRVYVVERLGALLK